MADEPPTQAPPTENGAERDGTEQQQRPLKLFEPATVEGLRGWQLHVSRRREIHERAARRTQT